MVQSTQVDISGIIKPRVISTEVSPVLSLTMDSNIIDSGERLAFSISPSLILRNVITPVGNFTGSITITQGQDIQWVMNFSGAYNPDSQGWSLMAVTGSLNGLTLSGNLSIRFQSGQVTISTSRLDDIYAIVVDGIPKLPFVFASNIWRLPLDVSVRVNRSTGSLSNQVITPVLTGDHILSTFSNIDETISLLDLPITFLGSGALSGVTSIRDNTNNIDSMLVLSNLAIGGDGTVSGMLAAGSNYFGSSRAGSEVIGDFQNTNLELFIYTQRTSLPTGTSFPLVSASITGQVLLTYTPTEGSCFCRGNQ